MPIASIKGKIISQFLNNAPPQQLNPSWIISQKDFARITVQWPRVYEWDGARDWVDILRIGFQNRVNIEIVDDIP